MLIKSPTELAKIKQGGKILGEILEKLTKLCRPGVSTWEIDQAAEKLIHEAGGRPAFKGYHSHSGESPFPSTICASLNHELVHGIAKKKTILKNGDIFSIDIGMEWPYSDQLKNGKKQPGYFTDTAITVPIGKIPAKTRELLQVTQEALEIGMQAVKPGNTIADIGQAIEKFVRSEGKYGIVQDLVGHGVGHGVHEEPRVPNYFDPSVAKIKILPGMVLAIEPMISLGGHEVKIGQDGWTIEMADCSLCGHFEHTVIVTKKGHEVVTRRPQEL